MATKEQGPIPGHRADCCSPEVVESFWRRDSGSLPEPCQCNHSDAVHAFDIGPCQVCGCPKFMRVG